MKLQDRNYELILTEKEQEAYEAELAYESKKGPKNTRNFPRFSHPDKEIRKFIWHKRSLFPNNFLYLGEYKDMDFELEASKLQNIIYTAENELKIQQYIKQNKKWFIPGSIFLDYNFGHHDAYLFPEQQLGNEYAADYMLVGKNSDGYSIVLIEFEKANTHYLITSANTESESVRKGLTQIQDWKRWIDSNRDYFLKNIELLQQGIDVPVYRIYYYLVVSRRDFMNLTALDVRSQSMYEKINTKIVTFDRLVDNIKKLGERLTW
ncbi:Shedu anti-phage system protein SduA domain-containing protein [Anaerotignum propionicum]|uniref:Shedu protein SduA C-terminal domain-containing protein n=1 Tax=Anaerotignum propionicum DSM 1682 TaxID=991789 RepID=A0A0X1U902_ANAPI|nr:Shedu anti-phage system protein SduA domain-containing protein [Anaerotignum propionicum]AMJ41394.1 hypothetical protein CPRO_18080 [Anaerotignum propionicum DSM 1682]SHE98659.1 protein of unknown function [[Clostridium] propionicum DSM 1682] [Anaerotignum propionicum DSM 1682]